MDIVIREGDAKNGKKEKTRSFSKWRQKCHKIQHSSEVPVAQIPRRLVYLVHGRTPWGSMRVRGGWGWGGGGGWGGDREEAAEARRTNPPREISGFPLHPLLRRIGDPCPLSSSAEMSEAEGRCADPAASADGAALTEASATTAPAAGAASAAGPAPLVPGEREGDPPVDPRNPARCPRRLFTRFKRRLELRGHEKPVSAVAFSPDGARPERSLACLPGGHNLPEHPMRSLGGRVASRAVYTPCSGASPPAGTAGRVALTPSVR